MDKENLITEKKSDFNYKKWGLWSLLAMIVLVGALWYLATPGPVTYSFSLDGQDFPAVSKCGLWRYENVSFIPCLWEGDIQGIFNEYINFTLSPEDNCAVYNSTFTGFNLKNETRADEMYSEVLPLCENLYAEDLSYDWLIENAGCLHYECPPLYATPPHIPYKDISCVKVYNVPFFTEAKEGFCTQWRTDDGLVINARR